jgi:hypothetical protein
MNFTLQIIENMIEYSYKKYFLILIIICSISISLKIFFTPFDFPLESQDALMYLHQAKQISIGNLQGIPTAYGWQSVLSFFFTVFPQETDYDYMNLLRSISIIISTGTIPAVFFFAKKFVDNRFALLAASFFAFDPNLIENSIFGISETLFLFLSILTLNFLFSNNHKLLYVAAIFAGLSLDVRLNGIILIIVTIIVIVTKPNLSSKNQKIFLTIILISISASPFWLQNIESSGNPFGGFIGIIKNAENSPPPSMESKLSQSSINDRFIHGITEEFKHIFRISIPFLVLFVPFGLLTIFSHFNYNNKILFLIIGITLIVSMPIYLRSIEYRNLFLLLPIFSIISVIGLQVILKNNNRKNIFIVLLVAGIILLSWNMLKDRSDYDSLIYSEKDNFGKYLAVNLEGKIMGDYYVEIARNLPNAQLGIVGKEQLQNDQLKLIGFGPPSNSINDLMDFAKKYNITHIIIDDKLDVKSPTLIEIFYDESKFPFLEKIIDSHVEGFNQINVKVFKINFDLLK